eukprot:scaffold22342_cov23-Tisochrysis_lutea.AAC.1
MVALTPDNQPSTPTAKPPVVPLLAGSAADGGIPSSSTSLPTSSISVSHPAEGGNPDSRARPPVVALTHNSEMRRVSSA